MSPLNRSGLWGRIATLLRAEAPLTTRQIADRLDADLDNVRRLLMVYAERGRAERVTYPDRNFVHWQLAKRDPRRDPRPGDALQRGRTMRHVARIDFTPCGALDKVHGPSSEVWSAIAWRAWALDGARVTRRGDP